MGELTAELVEQYKQKVEFLENRIAQLENGELVKEAKARNDELFKENNRLEKKVYALTEMNDFFKRIIVYFLDRGE